MKNLIISFFLLPCFINFAVAGSVGGIGGSTEVTQLMNNMELVSQYELMGEKYIKQIQQYERQLKDAVKLPTRVLRTRAITNMLSDTARFWDDAEGLGLRSVKIAQRLEQAYGSSGSPIASPASFRKWLQIGRETVSNQLKANAQVQDTSRQKISENIKALGDKLADDDVDGQVKVMQTVGEIQLTMVEQLQQLNDMNSQNHNAMLTHFQAASEHMQAKADATDAHKNLFSGVQKRNCTTPEALEEIKRTGRCQ